jgi:ATP-dependent DNA helicase UvrD/PcrA
MSDPTPQQQDVFDCAIHGTRHIIVNASAGSGKTWTITETARRISPRAISVFLAFNKRIADTLRTKLPPYCQAKTFHSHSYGALKLGSAKIPLLDEDKTRKIFRTLCEGDKEEFHTYAPFVSKLVGYGKGQPSTDPAWQDLVDYHQLLCDGNEERGIKYAAKVFDLSNKDLEHIDFDDMIYLTWLLNVPFTRADYLFVDEAQDLNAIQHALLDRMVKPTGKIIAVGDPYQSIYAFRGADSQSMPKLKAQFDMLELPLSVSFRCSKMAVYAAQHVLTTWLEHRIIVNKYNPPVPSETELCPLCGETADDCICEQTLNQTLDDHTT